ncbi:MAG TPA: sialidase family protein [Thermoanaerobaculia bacterium]|nr:sialidase family protein [Thermoanaerobaculia bacterium]
MSTPIPSRIAIALVLVLAGPGASAQLVDVATNATDPSNLADTEPSISVNPLNPQEIVIATFSEGWSAAQGAPLWRSTNGGASWSKVFILPQPAPASGGPGDQKLAYNGQGKLHVAELAGGVAVPRCLIYRQIGAGGTNLTPGAFYGDDQPHLDVDISGPSPFFGRAYSPWLDFSAALQLSRVTRSSNGGAAVATVAAGDNSAFSNRTTRIALAPGGRAYVIFKTREGALAGGFENAHFRVKRSDDGGVTWNALGVAGVSVHGAAAVATWFTNQWGNPAKGKVARARSSDAWIAADPSDGDVYAAYVKREASGIAQIFVARSTNGGTTWTSTRVSSGALQSAFPEVAVAANGNIGVLYVDYNDSGAATIFCHRFAKSTNNGATWSIETLQCMNPTTIPNAPNGFLWGDYEGLTAHGFDFYGVFTGQSIGRAVVQFDPIFFKRPAS